VKRFPLARNVVGRPTSYLEAVGGVDLEVRSGETVGLVGESGCGKSTLARLLLRLIEPTEGSIRFGDIDVLGASRAELRSFRQQAQIVFQDPFGSLDPRLRVGPIVAEGMGHLGLGRAERRARVAELLEVVELPAGATTRFPHEFSGGQRQRISIARALAVGPRLLIADEPVSSLDVSVQSKILNLLADLQSRLNLTYLFISHDMSVVRHVADRVAVMYLGKIVEIGPADEVFENPRHPYTQALLSSIPTVHSSTGRKRIKLTGDVPTAIGPAQGCRFASRCFRAIDRCVSTVPALEPLPGVVDIHTVACFNPAPLDEVGDVR
jgi:peptide/nickel transport system ATP-binding protein